jgi:two-component system chemotaxis response regulator CheY
MLKRILIVDDSESVRDVIRMFLKDVATVEICGEASDGLEAVEKTKRLRPDLVVLDLSLPSMNGVEVARFSTEYSQTDRLPRKSVVGSTDQMVLHRPFEPTRLIRSWLALDKY